jgi:hypothetical protein
MSRAERVPADVAMARTPNDEERIHTMVVLHNTSAIPAIEAGFHTLEIEDVQPVSSPSFDDPTQMEERLKVQLRVRTHGVADESFSVFMSPRLSEKATLGAIVRAVFGSAPPNGDFDTDLLIGQRFRHMVGHSDKGWPRLVPGTAASASESPF